MNRLGKLWKLSTLLACFVVAETFAQTADSFFNPDINYWVSPVAIQPDGKIIFGGDFSTVTGLSRSRIARINRDGSLDTGFNPGASDDLYALAVQPDGKILVGGDFAVLAGQTRRAIGRLNTNGTLDTIFNTTAFTPPPFGTLTARGQAILLQPDGKIIVAGRRSFDGGPAAGYVFRLNTNGSTDSSFTVPSVSGGPVTTLAWQPDGKILVGGLFSSVGGLTRNRIARLNENGSVDAAFNPGLATASGSAIALAFAVQPDGKIVVGGDFDTAAGQPRTNICRLNEDGTLDNIFNAAIAGVDPAVYSLALQADGKILVGGWFTSISGVLRSYVGRLNTNGTVDLTFNPGASTQVYGLAVQADGKTLVTGFFTQLGGQSQKYLGRLNATDPITQSLAYDGSTITWLRGGTSPEVWRTTFESSADGTNWTFLGAGSRIVGGWELTGVSLPPSTKVRARGYASGGGFNSSSWFVESLFPQTQPLIVTNDGKLGIRSNRFGFNFKGSAGSVVVIQASTNLLDWVTLETTALDSLPLYFADPATTNYPSRFYRTRLQ